MACKKCEKWKENKDIIIMMVGLIGVMILCLFLITSGITLIQGNSLILNDLNGLAKINFSNQEVNDKLLMTATTGTLVGFMLPIVAAGLLILFMITSKREHWKKWRKKKK